MLSMILLIIALILFLSFLALLAIDYSKKGIKKLRKENILKYILITYFYSIIFVYLAYITRDPLSIPLIGEISPDGVLNVILLSSFLVIGKIYNFFKVIRDDITTIKSELKQHISNCKITHDELEKRIGKKRR